MDIKVGKNKETSEEYDLLISELLSRAVEEYKQTEQYTVLKKELDKMNEECKQKFTHKDYTFVVECFSKVLDLSCQEQKYIYEKGIKDAFSLLKRLEVIN